MPVGLRGPRNRGGCPSSTQTPRHSGRRSGPTTATGRKVEVPDRKATGREGGSLPGTPRARRASATVVTVATVLVPLDIEVRDLDRVLLDVGAARLDLFAHQDAAELVRARRILDRDLQQRSGTALHRRVPQ